MNFFYHREHRAHGDIFLCFLGVLCGLGGKFLQFRIKNCVSGLFFILLVGCSPSSLEDLRLEGEAQTKKLASQLRAVETREQLQKAVPKLKKRFNRIAEILIQVRKVAQDPAESTEASEALFAEMARLYEIPGCRELIESAQEEAVRKLGRD